MECQKDWKIDYVLLYHKKKKDFVPKKNKSTPILIHIQKLKHAKHSNMMKLKREKEWVMVKSMCLHLSIGPP
jgi:hypothetical protein